MPGPVYKDSTSRCDPPSMLYDTIRNPNAPKTPPRQEIVIGKDTIESTQQRLNREVQEKFEGVGRRLPHESYVAVVQVGKYMFLAIMLPPYLCIYGIPRWLLIVAIPEVSLFVKNLSVQVGRFVLEISKTLGDLMKGLIDQMIGDSLKMMQRGLKNLWEQFASKIQNITAKISNTLNRLQARMIAIKNTILYPFHFIRDKAVKVMNTIAEAAEWIQRKSDKVFTFVKRTLVSLQQTIVSGIMAPIYGWLKEPLAQTFHAGKALGSYIAKQMVKGFQGVHEVVVVPVWDGIQHIAAGAFKFIQRTLQKMAQPVNDWIKEKIEVIGDRLKRIASKLKELISDAGNAFKNKFHEMIGPKVEFIQKWLSMIPYYAMQTAIWMWGCVPESIKNRFKRAQERCRSWGRSMKRFGGSVSSLMNQAIKGFSIVLKGLYHKFGSWLVNWVVSAVRWLRKQLLALPGNVLKVIISLWQNVKLVIRKIILGVRVVIAWTWVLCRQSRILMRELVDEISGWFSMR